MSRIEDALKRAREGEAVAPSSVPSTDLFKDAWAVEPLPKDGSQGSTTGPEERETAVSGELPAANQGGELREKGGALALFQGFNPKIIEKIVATPTVRPAFVEQYRRLAGTLHHAQVERNVRVIMVTSALAGEGKSLTSTNLALTFSESYRRSVLLVDADLRRPTLHDAFQVPNVSGLGDALRAEQDQRLTLVQVSPRLTLLTAGRPDPDPMSGLTSDRMKRVIEEATANYDWVILDTPPVGLLPDANLLAAMVDAALLVVQAGQTPYPLVQRAVAAVGRDRILGIVLNRAEDGLAGGYAYYSYYEAYGQAARQGR